MAENRPGSGGPAGRDPGHLSVEKIAELLSQPDAAGLEPGDVPDEEFLQLVSAASDAQIEAVMHSEARGQILGEIFRRMGEYVRADRLPRSRSVVHWRIDDGPRGGPDEFETVLDGDGVSARPGFHDEPRVTLTTGAVEFVKLVTGRASGPTLFLTRRLKIKGDMSLAAGLTSIFTIPKA